MTMISNRYTSTGMIATCLLPTALTGCNKTNGTSLTAPSTSIGNHIDDSVITTQVRSALLSNEAVKSLDIKVTTRKGEVMLSGFVDNSVLLAQAMDLEKDVEGVTGV